MRRFILLLSCLAVATLAGCGNKGPLVLPSHPATTATTATPATTAVPVESGAAATARR
ncbi:MAG TPA: lipoprotein [Rhodanobacter sp.]